MASFLLTIVAGGSFLSAAWFGRKAYLGWTRFIPGQPLDTIANKFAFSEAWQTGDLGVWQRRANYAAYALALAAGCIACVFAQRATWGGTLGFGVVCAAAVASAIRAEVRAARDGGARTGRVADQPGSDQR